MGGNWSELEEIEVSGGNGISGRKWELLEGNVVSRENGG